MPILDPTCDRSYLLGSLIQQCDACHWALSGHHAEFAECPRCGKPLDHPAAIEFGGLSLAWLGKHCRAYDSEGGSVTLYEADQLDTQPVTAVVLEELAGRLTHDPRLEAWADRVIHIEDGKILDDQRRTPNPDAVLASHH